MPYPLQTIATIIIITPEQSIRVIHHANKNWEICQQCMQYALRQEGVDWQVWVVQSGPALPCKFVITITEDSSHPQYTAVLTWNTESPAALSGYEFGPTADYSEFHLAEVGDGSDDAENGGSQ